MPVSLDLIARDPAAAGHFSPDFAVQALAQVPSILPLLLARAAAATGKLRLSYSAVQRSVRGLVAWEFPTSTPAGLVFQSDVRRWVSPLGSAGR